MKVLTKKSLDTNGFLLCIRWYRKRQHMVKWQKYDNYVKNML